MKSAWFAIGLLIAGPAAAESLKFDHRHVPEVGAVLDSGRTEMVHFDNSNPRYVLDRIAIKGSSADNWTEAMEIVVRLRRRGMTTPEHWLDEMRAHVAGSCGAELTLLASEEKSLTFYRDAAACPTSSATSGIYRIVAGKRSLYLVSVLYRGDMDSALRQRWLTLLGSARVNS